MIYIYSLKIPYTSGFNKIAKNQILIKYTEFKYGIYKNVYKPYINRIISVYIFLIGSYYKKEWQSCQQLWAHIYKPKFATGWMVNEKNNLIERFFSVSIVYSNVTICIFYNYM